VSRGVDRPADLARENEELRRRLDEADQLIRAISGGEVDAFVMRQGAEDQVLVLQGVDRPYRLLIERMKQGAATVAADGTIMYCNQRLSELLGVAASTLVGSKLEDYVTSANAVGVRALLAQAQTRDASVEMWFRTADDAVPTLVNASPLEVEGSRLLCVIVTDLTEQLRHEVDRQRAVQEEHARNAAEQTAALLRESDRRKDEFLAMLAHELRNPLAPLRNGIELLRTLGAHDADVANTREMMSRQVETLVRLIDDLLDVGRVTQGKIALRREPTDLRTVVHQAVETCRHAIDRCSHALRVELPQAPVVVEGDTTRLVQVVTNLLHNAAKFTPPSGEITLRVGRDHGGAFVSVADDGIGIAPELLPRVFDLFMQADGGMGRGDGGGLGIGLTLARRIVEMHGGWMEARSDGPGRGSEFVVRLPVCEAPLEAPLAPHVGKRSAPHRVLIVDDNRDAADSFARLLRARGHDVELAYGGVEALDLAARFHPTVAFLDLGMPGMNGLDLARTLRTRVPEKDLFLVALTGYATEKDRRHAIDAGFSHHLAKPVAITDVDEMLSRIAAPPPA
jgi:PAS domain S-box-containing protein